jgi:LPS-assembly lipoprotein
MRRALFKQNLSKLIVVFVLSNILLACGFHLRGAFQSPDEMSLVYLSANNRHSELLQDLQRTLKANGSVIVDDAIKAKARLKIKSEKQTQRVISVDTHGRASEYELKFEVVYSLSTVTESELTAVRIKDRRVTLIRDYLYDSSAVLGTSREKGVLIRDMQRDAARLIMLQIQAAYRATDSTAMPAGKLKP